MGKLKGRNRTLPSKGLEDVSATNAADNVRIPGRKWGVDVATATIGTGGRGKNAKRNTVADITPSAAHASSNVYHINSDGTFNAVSALGMMDENTLVHKRSETRRQGEREPRRTKDANQLSATRSKKAWEQAWAPSKQLFMTGFMLWMSGTAVNIFSMMFTVMAFFTPIKSIVFVNQQFDVYADKNTDVLMPKIVFVLTNLVAVGMALYKCWIMGLLPTEPSDFLGWLPNKTPIEISVGGLI